MKSKAGYGYLATAAHLAGESSTGEPDGHTRRHALEHQCKRGETGRGGPTECVPTPETYLYTASI